MTRAVAREPIIVTVFKALSVVVVLAIDPKQSKGRPSKTDGGIVQAHSDIDWP